MKTRRYRGLMKTINENICGDGYDADERTKFIFNKCQNRIDSAYEKGYQQGRADGLDKLVNLMKPCNICPSYSNECDGIDYFEDCCRTEHRISWEDLRLVADKVKQDYC